VQAKLKPALAVVMPVYNEAEGITDFLRELDDAFPGATLVVVDDKSTDASAVLIESAECSNVEVRLLENERNIGHGPSTLRALREGVATGAAIVAVCDGDGQIAAAELRALVAVFESLDCDVLEGVRMERQESQYRIVTSWATRILTRIRSGASVEDANTPFRVYDVRTLVRLLAVVPHNATVPNLWMTVASRRLRFRVRSVPVVTRSRLGASSNGSSWGASHLGLPSRRFVVFCARAVKEWLVQWPRVRHALRHHSP